MPVLLDTDHLSILQRRTQPHCGRLRQRLDRLPSDDIATTYRLPSRTVRRLEGIPQAVQDERQNRSCLCRTGTDVAVLSKDERRVVYQRGASQICLAAKAENSDSDARSANCQRGLGDGFVVAQPQSEGLPAS